MRSIAPALAVSLALLGCGVSMRAAVRPVPVEEVDAHGIRLARVRQLRRGDPVKLVVDILGAPADRQPGCVPGESIWRYPIRAWNDLGNSEEVVPAAFLRVSFDGSGTLSDWGFVDSSTGSALDAQETPDEGSRWYRTLSEAPPPIPPRIELEKILIRGKARAQDVERLLGQWQPDLHCGGGGLAPVVRKTTTDSGSVWDWYVDRPSPLFVPPHYLLVSVDSAGALIVWHLEGTYPGGRK